MGEVAKFDPNSYMQAVKDRIKGEFVSMIPDDQWNAMIQKEVDDFFKPKELGYQSQRLYASDFTIMTRDLLRAEAQRRLAEYLSSPGFTTTWDTNGQPHASEQVEEMFIKNSGLILKNMFAGMFSMMANDFANQLRNKHL